MKLVNIALIMALAAVASVHAGKGHSHGNSADSADSADGVQPEAGNGEEPENKQDGSGSGSGSGEDTTATPSFSVAMTFEGDLAALNNDQTQEFANQVAGGAVEFSNGTIEQSDIAEVALSSGSIVAEVFFVPGTVTAEEVEALVATLEDMVNNGNLSVTVGNMTFAAEVGPADRFQGSYGDSPEKKGGMGKSKKSKKAKKAKSGKKEKKEKKEKKAKSLTQTQNLTVDQSSFAIAGCVALVAGVGLVAVRKYRQQSGYKIIASDDSKFADVSETTPLVGSEAVLA